VAAWVADKFCNFQALKNHKNANNSTTTEAREKNAQISNPCNFRKKCYVLLNFKEIKFYLIKLATDSG
jgi:hypothetical protein